MQHKAIQVAHQLSPYVRCPENQYADGFTGLFALHRDPKQD